MKTVKKESVCLGILLLAGMAAAQTQPVGETQTQKENRWHRITLEGSAEEKAAVFMEGYFSGYAMAEAGKPFKFSMRVPEYNRVLNSVFVMDGDKRIDCSCNADNSECSFVMPNNDVVMRAVLRSTYLAVLPLPTEHGSYKFYKEKDGSFAEMSLPTTLFSKTPLRIVVKPDDGYLLDQVALMSAEAADRGKDSVVKTISCEENVCDFQMIPDHVKIKVTFREKNDEDRKLEALALKKEVEFDPNSGCGYIVVADTNMGFVRVKDVTTGEEIGTGGYVCAPKNSEMDVITISGEPKPGFEIYDFGGWYGKASMGKALAFSSADVNGMKFVMRKGTTAVANGSAKSLARASAEVGYVGEVAKPGAASMLAAPKFSVKVSGRNVHISNGAVGVGYDVVDAHGRVVLSGRVDKPRFSLSMPSAGTYMVRMGGQTQRVTLR